MKTLTLDKRREKLGNLQTRCGNAMRCLTRLYEVQNTGRPDKAEWVRIAVVRNGTQP
jgi:hypothetical protein